MSDGRRVAYFDCFSGISGNMILGGLVDLGVPPQTIEAQLGKLPLESFAITSSVEKRAAVRGVHVSVKVKERPAKERTYQEIRELIEKSALDERVKQIGTEIFRRLAEAEGRIHGQNPDEVHFHEVGALDSIVDIVGGLIGMDHLAIDAVHASRIPLGRGTIASRHGILPIPAPATVEILRGVPVYDAGIDGELVTPTGAAFIKTLADQFGRLPDMEIENVGYGFGDRDLPGIPNSLRIILGKTRASLAQDRVCVVETDIDDMNPEFFEPLMDALFARGALDVSLIPLQRKKNRPGITVRAICEEYKGGEIARTILRESTSIGVRYFSVQREKLNRRVERVNTLFGEVRIKISQDQAGAIYHVSPEYEDCLHLSREKKTTIMDVYEEALAAARDLRRGR